MNKITLLFLLVFPLWIPAQTLQVLDAENPQQSFSWNATVYLGMQTPIVLSGNAGEITQLAGLNSAEWKDGWVEIQASGYLAGKATLRKGEDLTVRLQKKEVILSDVVVTAQYSPGNPEQSVHRIRVIDRQTMDAQGAVTLSDVLQYEVNMRVSQDQILGSGISMQGISGQNIKILIDGVPVVGRLDGNIDLSQLNLSNIERIEIVEGPLSVNYGTDALGGTINLITRKSNREKASFELNNYVETAGQYNTDGRLGFRKGKHQVTLSGGRTYFDGWSPNDPFFQFPKSRPADTLRSKSWNPKEQLFGQVAYQYQGKKIQFRPFADVFSEKITNRGFPRAPYFESAFDDYYFTKRYNGGGDFIYTKNNRFRIQAVAAFNHYQREKLTYLKDLTTLESILSGNLQDLDTTVYNAAMSRGSLATTRDSARIHFEWGYDLKYESTLGTRIEGGLQTQGDYATFASAEWSPLKGLVVRPGIRAMFNTAYRAPIIPSLNIRYKWSEFTLRTSYARGFRAPSLKELFFEFVDINHNIQGNSNLEAEYSHNFQVFGNWNTPRDRFAVKIEAGGFYNAIENLITLAQLPGTFQYSYVNVEAAKTLGFQLGGDYRSEKLKIAIQGLLTGRSNSLSDSFAIQPFSFSPEISANIRYEFPKVGITVSSLYKLTGALPGFALNDQNQPFVTRLDGYHMMDISASKYWFSKRFQTIAGVNNLLNVQNIQSSGLSGGIHSGQGTQVPVSWGRSIFLTLRLHLNTL